MVSESRTNTRLSGCSDDERSNDHHLSESAGGVSLSGLRFHSWNLKLRARLHPPLAPTPATPLHTSSLQTPLDTRTKRQAGEPFKPLIPSVNELTEWPPRSTPVLSCRRGGEENSTGCQVPCGVLNVVIYRKPTHTKKKQKENKQSKPFWCCQRVLWL